MTPKKQFIVFLMFVVGFLVILMIAFGRRPNTNTSNSSSSSKVFEVLEYQDKDARLTSLISGPITGDDEHRSIKITITRNSRLIEVFQGYQGKVIKSESYPNNVDAYDEFINALAKVNYGKKRRSDSDSEIGICATGRRYVYEVFDENNDSVSRTWAGSCTKGTVYGSSEAINNLFRMQITDYSKLISGVNY
ncbi:hypothetical protein KDA11_05420 [Candidatus Saccharibacteria bacterium]|nr:hypothetical protein [Candidatus Saccharibacteria bacterium]